MDTEFSRRDRQLQRFPLMLAAGMLAGIGALSGCAAPEEGAPSSPVALKPWWLTQRSKLAGVSDEARKIEGNLGVR